MTTGSTLPVVVDRVAAVLPCHPKGRSAAEDPRSGLTRRSRLAHFRSLPRHPAAPRRMRAQLVVEAESGTNDAFGGGPSATSRRYTASYFRECHSRSRGCGRGGARGRPGAARAAASTRPGVEALRRAEPQRGVERLDAEGAVRGGRQPPRHDSRRDRRGGWPGPSPPPDGKAVQ